MVNINIKPAVCEIITTTLFKHTTSNTWPTSIGEKYLDFINNFTITNSEVKTTKYYELNLCYYIR